MQGKANMTASIAEMREEIKTQLLAQKDSNLPALIFRKTDSFIRAISKRKTPLPTWYIILFISILIQLPTLILTNIFHETSQWKAFGLIWIGYIEFGFAATILAYCLFAYFIRELHDWFIDSVLQTSNLVDLKEQLQNVWDIWMAGINMLLFSVVWSIMFSWASSWYLREFIGYGLVSGTLVFGLAVGAAWSYLLWFIRFTGRLAKYEFDLFLLAPVHSEFIVRIKRFYNNIMYAIMGYFLLCVVLNAFNIWAELLTITFSWIPAIFLFLAYQNSLRQIIIRSKWKYLDRVQSQITDLSSKGVSDKSTLETINCLMDYHERIRLTPDSAMDIRSVLSFLNQLMLPLLGFLVANLDRIIGLFR